MGEGWGEGDIEVITEYHKYQLCDHFNQFKKKSTFLPVHQIKERTEKTKSVVIYYRRSISN